MKIFEQNLVNYILGIFENSLRRKPSSSSKWSWRLVRSQGSYLPLTIVGSTLDWRGRIYRGTKIRIKLFQRENAAEGWRLEDDVTPATYLPFDESQARNCLR